MTKYNRIEKRTLDDLTLAMTTLLTSTFRQKNDIVTTTMETPTCTLTSPRAL